MLDYFNIKFNIKHTTTVHQEALVKAENHKIPHTKLVKRGSKLEPPHQVMPPDGFILVACFCDGDLERM